MIEEILKYSTEIPELRASGLPWMKEDYKIQKSKYINLCKNSTNQDELLGTLKENKSYEPQKVTCNLIQMDPSLPRIPIIFHNNQKQISATILIDSCSSACIISHEILNLLQLTFVKKKYQLITANTTDEETLTGNVDLDFTIYDNNDQETNLIKWMFLVSKSDINIIGIDFLKKYNYRLNTDNLELEFPSMIYQNKEFITSESQMNQS